MIDWNQLDLRKHSGEERTTCPSCSPMRKNKKEKCFSVNHNDGVGYCHHCNEKTFRDKKEFTYTLPPQTWHNFTNLSDGLTKYLQGRGFKQSTIKHFKPSEEKQYQPARQKEMNCLVFNYFEGEKVVNKKYRSGGKDFTQTKDGKKIFYNINAALGAKEVWIVEGEFDVWALHQELNVVAISLPNGANDHDSTWVNSKPYLQDVERFVIATDNDAKGVEVREKIAQRLGRYKCEFVEFKGKDANDDLKTGDLKNLERKKFPVSGTFTVSDIFEDLLALRHNGLPKTLAPKHESFGDLKNIFTVMRGHLITATGIPSSGKSNYAEWYILNLINDHNLKASFFSPEHSPMELHTSNFVQKAIGKNFWQCTDMDLERYRDWADEKIYLTQPEKGQFPSWDWMLEKMKEQMFTKGIDIFCIDAFNKLELPKGNNLQAINQVLTKLTMFAQLNNVMIFLVAHPTKMKKDEDGMYQIPSLYDVSGSADFRNQTHDGFCIHRYYPNEQTGDNGYSMFVNLKTKYSFQGKIGESVRYHYDIPTGRYYAFGQSCPAFDMTRKEETQEILPNLEFSTDSFIFEETKDDLPF